MPKINLLTNAVAEAAPPNPRPARILGQVFIVAGALVALLVAIGIDYAYSNQKATEAKDRLAKAKAAKAELEKVKKEADEFKKKKDAVEARLKVIKDLSAEQRGPVALLSYINERIPKGIKLEKITQKGNSITIEGVSDKKNLVTEFAQQLELRSNGLFTNVDPTFKEGGQTLPDPTEAQVIQFQIACLYNPPKPVTDGSGTQTASVK
jgi:type IV pilus assembly protein PilN